jgi:hypothetical protein
MVCSIIGAEAELRGALRAFKTAAAKRSSREKIEGLEAAVVVAAVKLAKVANDSAMRTVYGLKQPWAPEALFRAVPPARTDEALRLLKVADVALDDDEIRSIIARCVGAAGPGRSPAPASSPQEAFAVSWPYAATAFNQAAVLFIAGERRKASFQSDRGLTLLAATGVEPTELVRVAIAGTQSMAVAQQVVVGVVSHACITRQLAVDGAGNHSASRVTIAARFAAAEATAAIGVELAQTLDEVAVAAAAQALADGGHPFEADRRGHASTSFAPRLRHEWPGMLVGAAAVPLLRGFALYNHGVTLSDAGNVSKALQVLRSAEHWAEKGLGSTEHAFVRMIRSRLCRLEAGPADRATSLRCRCEAAARGERAARSQAVSKMPLAALRAAHGRQQQTRAMSAAGARRASRGPSAAIQRRVPLSQVTDSTSSWSADVGSAHHAVDLERLNGHTPDFL